MSKEKWALVNDELLDLRRNQDVLIRRVERLERAQQWSGTEIKLLKRHRNYLEEESCVSNPASTSSNWKDDLSTAGLIFLIFVGFVSCILFLINLF